MSFSIANTNCPMCHANTIERIYVNGNSYLQCQECGEEYPLARYQLKHINYKFCKGCADKLPSPTRTIVPMHKSNYMMITDMDDLKGINNKGGLHR